MIKNNFVLSKSILLKNVFAGRKVDFAEYGNFAFSKNIKLGDKKDKYKSVFAIAVKDDVVVASWHCMEIAFLNVL